MTPLDQVRHKLKSQVAMVNHMGIDLVSWDGSTVVTEAPLEPNLNTHGTAFGGSLYCVGVMTGWSAVHLTLLDAGFDPSVWVVKAEVAYKTPVRGVLRGQATVNEATRAHLIHGMESKGRVKATIDVVINEGDAEGMTLQAVFAAMKP